MAGLLKSATLHDIKLKPGNPDLPKDLSSKENFATSPLASPMRRMNQGSLTSPMSPPSRGAESSDYEDASPRRAKENGDSFKKV